MSRIEVRKTKSRSACEGRSLRSLSPFAQQPRRLPPCAPFRLARSDPDREPLWSSKDRCMELQQLPAQSVLAAEQASEVQNQPAATSSPPPEPFSLDKKALWSLAGQHLVCSNSSTASRTPPLSSPHSKSSSWGSRTFEFAAYLNLIVLFPDTCVQLMFVLLKPPLTSDRYAESFPPRFSALSQREQLFSFLAWLGTS